MLSQRSFDTGVVELGYVEGPPAGPPLVLLHGVGSRWQDLFPLLPTLVLQWRVYAVDLRGHGRSGRTPGAYRLADYAQDILAFEQTVIGEPAALVGHSLGGWVALSVAARQPALVHALVVADTPISGVLHPAAVAFNRTLAALAGREGAVRETAQALAAVPLGEQQGRVLRLGDVTVAPLLRSWAKALTLTDPEVLEMLADGRLLAGYDPEPLLAAVRCPTLLIQADPARGASMTDADVARASALLADVTHIRLAGLGHALHQEDTEAVIRPLTSFLASL